MKKTMLTLTLITKNDNILLGYKKRGFGMGRYNGFGGKLESNESIEEAARREVFEESSLEVKNLKKIGILDFTWQNNNNHLEVHLFHCDDYQGHPEESEEMKPEWYNQNNIPFKKMWDDDKYWFPLFLKGKKFNGSFLFDKNDKVVKHSLEIL